MNFWPGGIEWGGGSKGISSVQFNNVYQIPMGEITAIAHMCVEADTPAVASSPTLETGGSPKALHTPHFQYPELLCSSCEYEDL